MAETNKDKPSFPPDFDSEITIGPEDGNKAYFGQNVLRGLIEGIDDFIQFRQPRWRPTLAPVEYDDEAFRDILAEMRWDEGETEDFGLNLSRP
jgi:hypothetical protein